MENKLRIFLLESPSPLDLLQNRTEVRALEEICLILGFEVKRFFMISKQELINHIKYISSIFEFLDEDDDTPLCIHVSTHGNKNGMAFGSDFIEWDIFLETIGPILKESYKYSKDIIFVFSACGAGNQKITSEFKKLSNLLDDITPPRYLFVTAEDEVAWDDALIAWSNFYHQISKISMSKRSAVQNILNKIKSNCEITLKYFRWDKRKMKYLSYSGK